MTNKILKFAFSALLLLTLSSSIPIFSQESQANALYLKANALADNNDYIEAIPLYLQAIAAYEKEGLENTAEYAQSLHSLGKAYTNIDDLDNATIYTKKALDLRKKILGEESEDYITSLNNYAFITSLKDDWEEAYNLESKVIELCSKLPTEHPLFKNMFAYNMGRFCYLTERYSESAEYLEMALPYIEKYSSDYEAFLTVLHSCYKETGDREGEERILVLTEDHNTHELSKECNEPTCMRERAEYYYVTGNNAKAKECYISALSMNMTDKEKIEVYDSYAKFLFVNQDFSSAADYFLLCAKARKALDGITQDYANTMFTAASSCFSSKRYEDAIQYYQDASNCYLDFDNKEKIAQCSNGIGNSLRTLKRYDEAKVQYEKVLDYYLKNDPQNEGYPKAIVSIANTEKFNKQYDEAISHYKEALAIYQERGMAEEYDNTSHSLKLCYAYAGKTSELSEEEQSEIEQAANKARNKKLDDIIQEELDNLELYHPYLGELSYANSLATIASSYYLEEDYDNAVEYYRKYIDAIRNAIKDEFRLRSVGERMILWNSEVRNINEILDLLVTLPQGKEDLYPEMSAICYDAMLLSKGILLNSSIEFERVLANAEDKNLQDIYTRTKQIASEIENLRSKASTDEDFEKILELSREGQSLQLELYKGCAEYADFTEYIQYKWQDVQQALETDDIAIEFTQIQTGRLDDDNFIGAIVLTKEATTPMAFQICNMVSAKQIVSDEEIFDYPESFWQVLKEYLVGKKRLFFSADGLFNNIGIEYLQFDGKPLSEQMEVYRLSSTKELCRKLSEPAIKDVVIFGGIDYSGLEDTNKQTERKLDKMKISTRSGFADLEHTLREAQEISKIFKERKVPNVILLTDKQASESAFRKLDYSNINVLHIATHGMYEEISGASDTESMENSVLAFAGVNTGGDQTTNNDGIVSAADVAKMNLRECDLAVLSACETGLGKLGNDGVFGLQRGFKNAGTRSLLMSLNPVDDKATTELMVSFYRHFLSGKSKREALSLAQEELRSSGYTDSQYWATFILLDGM